MGDEALFGDVVLVDPPVVLFAAEDAEGLTRWEPPEVGNADLDDEASPWLQMRRRVAEARDLRLLCRQILDGVEHHVHE